MKTKNIILIPLFFLALIVTPQYSAPNFDDIVLKGDRNLKIINMIYEKYPFMPAKKNYYAQIEQSWIKSKAEYFTSSSQNRKEKFTQFLKTYETTNEVLKDICIDMANYSDVITDDITQKLIETGTKQISVRH
ncbi:MAG: hypothetical protein OEV66_02175, partial [Spirochaetia bacterium]|nr:hypothetical protein [Spirochaetia bacterium]